MIGDWLIGFFLVLGAIFILLSSIGLLRFPDVYTRMHATTKASTLGLVLILIAVMLFVTTAIVVSKSIFVIIYIFITTPVASHMIGRAAHRIGVEKTHLMHRDDLESDNHRQSQISKTNDRFNEKN